MELIEKGLIQPVFAIGCETTGTILQTSSGDFELDFQNNEELLDIVELLDGKIVTVTGRLKIKKGVEISERKIIVVEKVAC